MKSIFLIVAVDRPACKFNNIEYSTALNATFTYKFSELKRVVIRNLLSDCGVISLKSYFSLVVF